MMKELILIFVILFTWFLSTSPVYSDDMTCLGSYAKMTMYMESAERSMKAGDACGTADGIEMALNWLITCEQQCAHDKRRMNNLRKLKKDLMSVFPKYIKACGH